MNDFYLQTCFIINLVSFHRPQYLEDMERLGMIDETLGRLSECVTESPVAGGRSSSRELSGTLKVMKRIEHVFQGTRNFLSKVSST